MRLQCCVQMWGNNVGYTDHIICEVLINWIYEICIETLGIPDILEKAMNDMVALVKNGETAHNAELPSSLSAVSSFWHLHKTPQSSPVSTQGQPDRSAQASCLMDCKKMFSVLSNGALGWNAKPNQVGIDCFRAQWW